MTDTPTPPPATQTATPAPLKLSVAELRAKQNFPLAAVAGFAAALVGAGIWAAVTVSSNMKIGLLAVGIGFLVGQSVKKTGNGIDPKFGYLGATLALFGTVAGDILCTMIFHAERTKEPLMTYMSHQTVASVIDSYSRGFQAMDVVFYGIALYQGYVLSFRYRLIKPKAPVAK